MDKDKIIAKQDELISRLNRMGEYLHANIENGRDEGFEEVMDVKLAVIKKLESDLASLKSQPEPEAEGAEEMNQNEKEIVSNVMRVLQDFYRRSDYELEQATGDIMNIFARQFHPSPEIPEISDEEIEKAFPVDRVAIDALFSDDMKGEERREAISWTRQKNLFKRTGIIWYRTKLREGGKKDE